MMLVKLWAIAKIAMRAIFHEMASTCHASLRHHTWKSVRQDF